MKDIVLVSTNQGKIAEIKALLEPLKINLLPISQFTDKSAPEESPTFVENALSKARFGSQISKLPSLADDSGLIVPALQGKPGVLSARYANSQLHGDYRGYARGNELANAGDQANRSRLLSDMQELCDEERKAFFICVIVILRHPYDPHPIIAEGKWYGAIATEEKGDKGFGYDPIFYIPELGKTAAQLKPQEKNTLSHRAKALQSAMGKLKEYIQV